MVLPFLPEKMMIFQKTLEDYKEFWQGLYNDS